jgi:hypothetical protein
MDSCLLCGTGLVVGVFGAVSGSWMICLAAFFPVCVIRAIAIPLVVASDCRSIDGVGRCFDRFLDCGCL